MMEAQEFTISSFETERGTILRDARIKFGTCGSLNEAGDNAVLLPSHYMGNFNGYGWLIGPDKCLDPSSLFLIATEMFGNGRSSSPSNTPPPHDGCRFPSMTIRDNVNAVHKLLTEHLNVTRLKAVIGFSMGAQQAFQWAVSFPQFVDGIVATAGTAKTYGHGHMRLEGQIAAIVADPVFNNGEYSEPPKKGLEAFGVVWGGWLFSQEWWRKELWREWKSEWREGSLAIVEEHFKTNFIPGADANDLIFQMRVWQGNNVGDTSPHGGNVEEALKSISVPVLYMPSETDLYFPLGDAQYEAQFIAKCLLVPIPSVWGHPAGAAICEADGKFLNDNISSFLSAL